MVLQIKMNRGPRETRFGSVAEVVQVQAEDGEVALPDWRVQARKRLA